MKPIEFPEANLTLGPPKGMEGSCDSLSVHRTDEMFVSCWELDDEDISNLVKTRKLWMYVYGRAHPPILPYTNYPFKRG